MKNADKVEDYMMVKTREVLGRVRAEFERSGTLYSTLNYWRDDKHCSLPMFYEGLIEIGEGVRKNRSSFMNAIDKMGPEAVRLTISMSERSENPEHRDHDKRHFGNALADIMTLVRPDCFVIVHMIRATAFPLADPMAMFQAILKGPSGAKTSILAVGHSAIRTYGLIIPFSKKKKTLTFEKTETVADHLDGGVFDDRFGVVYRPKMN